MQQDISMGYALAAHWRSALSDSEEDRRSPSAFARGDQTSHAREGRELSDDEVIRHQCMDRRVVGPPVAPRVVSLVLRHVDRGDIEDPDPPTSSDGGSSDEADYRGRPVCRADLSGPSTA